MLTTDGPNVSVGDSIDVIGFPTIRGFIPTLENATIRLGGSVLPAAPKPVTAGEMFNGDYDGRLVRIDAELIGRDLTAEKPTLLLRSGDVLFSASLPAIPGPEQWFSWKDGSLLRITGICTLHVDSLATGAGEGRPRPDSIKLLLNSTESIQVLHAPSWWTPQHALKAVTFACFMACIALAWIFVLRRQVEQQTEALRESKERLRHLSEHDALTNLPNRILLNDRLGVALQRAQRFESRLGLLMVDVDGFKVINDSLGHLAGDRVLCAVAARLTGCVRATDTVARMGGDEFIVLLVAAISLPIEIAQAQTAVTVSIGVSVYPDGGTDMESMLQAADLALYLAKERGKNGFQVFKPNMARAAASTSASQANSQTQLPVHGS
jgi:GGDEF domain-containing protein